MNHQEKLEVFNEVKADCVWHEKQQAELKEAAMPLVKYLRTHCTPMHVAIVDVAGVDLYAKDVNVPIEVSKYRCLSCKASFLDEGADYKYCPYCGRKITKTVN